MDFPAVSISDVPAITAQQMQQLIMLATGKFGLDNRVLVEHTARNIALMVDQFANDGPILVVAGRGNNGSGGLAAARLLGSRGRRVWVVPTHEAENYSGTPKEQLEHLKHFPRVRVTTSLPKMKFGAVIDAAIGTNLEGPPRGRTLDVINVLNSFEDVPIISIDVPTGMLADDGDIPGDVVNADYTMAIGLPKIGAKPGAHVGRLFVGDLCLPPELLEELRIGAATFPAFITELTG